MYSYKAKTIIVLVLLGAAKLRLFLTDPHATTISNSIIASVTTHLPQLCAEDYRWWWRSFMTSGSTALYVFLYSIVYFSRLESNMFVTYLLYFGYMAVISLGVFLVTGECVRFVAQRYVRRILM